MAKKYKKRYNGNPKYRNKKVYDEEWYKTYDEDYENVRHTAVSHKSYNQLKKDSKFLRKEMKARRKEIRQSKNDDLQFIFRNWKSWALVFFTMMCFAFFFIMKPSIKKMLEPVEDPKTEFIEIKIKSKSPKPYELSD